MASKKIKLPKAYVGALKKEAVKIDTLKFGDSAVDIEIKQTVSPVELAALVNFCIDYATVHSGESSVYDDRFYQIGFRLGVIATFTNLDINSYADDVQYLVTGENSLYWFIAPRIDADTFDLVNEACSTRRDEELKNRENALSPLGGLMRTIKNAVSQAADYLNAASEHIEEDVENTIYDAVADELKIIQNKDSGEGDDS